MANSIGSVRSVPEPVAAMIARPVTPIDEAQRAPPQGQAADLRLVIEEDPSTGAFIYKTLDRRTGEVVQQLPRETVLKARTASDYQPGLVVDTWD